MSLAPVALTGLVAFAAPAAAGDHIYADSFGNLIVDSAAGYKRIVVGQGHLARKAAQFSRSHEPGMIYPNAEPSLAMQDCFQGPVLIKGRSYMYGFDQGEIPFQGGPCL
jgi:hypothetical protein